MTALPLPAPPERIIKDRPYNASARFTNALARTLCATAALIAIILLVMITGYVIYEGISCFIRYQHFQPAVPAVAATEGVEAQPAIPMVPEGWHLDFSLFTEGSNTQEGLRNCIAGSMVLIAMSGVIGIPLGMLCGIYLAEYSRGGWFSASIRLIVDVLAGVPSILVGVLGYQLLVKGFYIGPIHVQAGFSAWAGAAALAFIMCPIVARATEEMLKLVPKAHREASIGLGGFKYQTLFRVVLPSARAGIITGIMLSIARVAGETAPLIMTALGSDQPAIHLRPIDTNHHIISTFNAIGQGIVHGDLVDVNHPFPSLTLKIYEYATSPDPDWVRQAWGGMLILVVMILSLNMAVRYVSRQKSIKPH